MDYIWTPWRYQYMKAVTGGKHSECIFCDALARKNDPEALSEMMRLAQRVETILRDNYKCDGMNLGMNLGRAAGAGVLGHLHLHALPRWMGDSNFMTVVGETRVHPEDLSTTYERLSKALA